jgi:hypothetical protein
VGVGVAAAIAPNNPNATSDLVIHAMVCSFPVLFLLFSLAKTLTVRCLFRWNFGSTLFVRRARKGTR